MRRCSDFVCGISPPQLFLLLLLLSSFFITVTSLAIGAECNPLHSTNNLNSFESVEIVNSDVSLLEQQPYRTSILLKIGYDGLYFKGWSAANRSQRSVEGELKKRLAKIFGNLSPDCVIVEGCSRTDKGVHARGMVALAYALTPAAMKAAMTQTYINQPSIPGKLRPHPWNSTDSTDCFVPIQVPNSKIGFALNRMSGDDLRIFAVASSPPAFANVPFHPTIHARWKTYHYTVSTGLMADPIRRKRVWHVGQVNDDECFLQLMKDAASVLQGLYDFTAFSCSPKGPDDRKKRRNNENYNGVCQVGSINVTSCNYQWRDTREYTISIKGDRFLYKMVRMLVGAIVAVGMNDVKEFELTAALQSIERPPFACAPAHGLVLDHVDFDTLIEWEPVNS